MTELQTGNSVSSAVSVEALKQRLAGLSPEKLAALQRKLQQQERSGYQPIRALPNEDIYPLSFHQRRLWFIEQLQPGTPLYNVSRAIQMRGPLNREALGAALQSLVDRHEVLRTTFHTIDAEPMQRVNSGLQLQLPVIRLRTDNDETDTLLQQRLTDEGRRVFDLSADLMIRAVLFQLNDDEYVLQLTIHHLACDGWSLQLLFNDLTDSYRELCLNKASDRPPVSLRYVDFARWQREPEQTEVFAERALWWKDRLEGAPPVLDLATDRPRPRIESGSGAIQPLDIPTELIEKLEMLSREEDATRYMMLLTGFFILLHRYTGVDDLIVGSMSAGRHRLETHGIVGFFVDTVALRVDLSGQPTARQVLQRVRRTVIDAVEHSDVPFDRVVQAFDLPRDLSRHPLFQVVFNAPPQSLPRLHELDIAPIDIDLQMSRFDLEMNLWQQPKNLRGALAYNTDLFDASTIERMLGHFVTLLEGVVADPNQRISELPLLTRSERHQLLVEWNDTAVEFPRDQCLHDLFEQQVERTPAAVAVVFEDQELTYRGLNERANQLAHHLRSLGVGPQTLVGLCLERSAELVVGILGILKAGGAWVPLDADYPPQRLKFMLTDAKIEFLVTQQPLLGRLPVSDCQVVCLDTDTPTLRHMARSNPPVNAAADNLVYVMFTSGSTGQPKGVQIPHSAVVNFLTAMAANPGLTSDDRLMSVTTPTFDISVLELMLPLMTGASVDVVSADLTSDASGLAARLRDHPVTVMQATPATWQMLIHGGWKGCDHLKVLCGGEALPDSLAQELQQRCGELWNLYGPTETTIWSTTMRVANGGVNGSIGRPIANTQVYVLDQWRQPVPIGVPGELYIGGAGLARGYLNRPELTAEKFVANPFSADPDSRLYRTGDLCRWRADENLEFLGRLDDQIKLRGFRIELGEIEAVLSEHPDVAQSVVSLREDRPGDKRLVGYCVPSAGARLRFAELSRDLRSRLPDYMVPTAFVGLETLPLTSSGKVNRRVLPAPDDSRPELETGYVAPRNAIEEQLTVIWRDVLGVRKVGIHDNYFELGGHSLLALKLFARIEKEFGRKWPLQTLFQAPSIAELSDRLQLQDWEPPWSPLVPLQPNGTRTPFYLAHPVGCNLLVYSDMVRQLGPDQPVYGLQPVGLDGDQEPLTDLSAMAALYVDAIRAVHPEGPYRIGGTSLGGDIAWEMARQLDEAGQSVTLLALFDVFGPVVHKTLRRMPARRNQFLHQMLRVRNHWMNFWWRERSQKFTYMREVAGNAYQRAVWKITTGRRDNRPEEIRRVSQANRLAHRRHTHCPVRVPITLFRARAQVLGRPVSRAMGWEELALGGIQVHDVPGYHGELCREPYLGHWIDQLHACLRKSEQTV